MTGIEKSVRSLGAEIQKDRRWIAYNEAKKKNDSDEKLQNKILDFNLLTQQMRLQMSKNKNFNEIEKLKSIQEKHRSLYAEIMQVPSMTEFAEAKSEFDDMVKGVMGLLDLCILGENPETCEYTPRSCEGECGGCSGCN